jgi:nitroreductase
VTGLADLVRRRRMTRNFTGQPLEPGVLEHLVSLASRAPSAGKTQGWHLLVLEGAQTAAFWDLSLPEGRRSTFRWQGLLAAPVVALVLADPQAYLDRYAEPDKSRRDLGSSLSAWPAPYWTIDAAMATMVLLLAAEDLGLGALFFGIFNAEEQIRERFQIPSGVEIVGALALGHGDPDAAQQGRSAQRRRRSPAEIIRRGTWSGGAPN